MMDVTVICDLGATIHYPGFCFFELIFSRILTPTLLLLHILPSFTIHVTPYLTFGMLLTISHLVITNSFKMMPVYDSLQRI